MWKGSCFWIGLWWASAAMGQGRPGPRHMLTLDTGWRTIASETNPHAGRGAEAPDYRDSAWLPVNVPHNWDDYGGYRRLKNGNRYGYAWYRKLFRIPEKDRGRRYFLWFEGVGAYATVWLNGRKVGTHVGGRTSFTLEVTKVIHLRGPNLLSVEADEPQGIRDLPWVSGGDSPEPGFSEGSQPLGIFRPVHLVTTADIHLVPFGLHAWNDTTISEKTATVSLETTLRNEKADSGPVTITVENRLIDPSGNIKAKIKSDTIIHGGSTIHVIQSFVNIPYPHLWSPSDPYLYRIETRVWRGGLLLDEVTTPYGIRWIRWPGPGSDDPRFLVNGRPVFINGVAEYEHLLGGSQALSAAEIKARVRQAEAAGFNAFRDAHQPHNLRYAAYFEKDGLLWWPQFAAHIWFDNPAFRQNFLRLLRDWVIERRNNPSVILWGLENESTLPEAFARQCADEIRRLDPTASTQRLITTCNGGSGTDWNVPQNWSGTYGGDPSHYAAEVQQERLVGEYGAWRTIDLHTEGPFRASGPTSENRMAQLLEMKIKQADSVKDRFAGQFLWLLYSHDNPGRVQSGEGYRGLDQVGPVNYKGLFTIWGEPVDAYYLYRANYTSAKMHPMVYIVSHRWADRWTRPGIKSGITVYSNCDSVELFNDLGRLSLGKRTRKGRSTHFEWDDVPVRYNVLYAVGYAGDRAVAHDCIVLNHLPPAPAFARRIDTTDLLCPQPGYRYLYRVNCGGPGYRDTHGHLWMADRALSGTGTWGSLSWADRYPGLPPYFASQRTTSDPVSGTRDEKLFQTFRYGRQYLQYRFPVPDGEYRVELYFMEPWYGLGGGVDCTGWRLFDVAVNGRTQIHRLDIWKEAGTDRALKKAFLAQVKGGQLVLSFPETEAGEAVIAGIAIATRSPDAKSAPSSPLLIDRLTVGGDPVRHSWQIRSWLNTGDAQYDGHGSIVRFSALPPFLYGACWIRPPGPGNEMLRFRINQAGDLYVGVDSLPGKRPVKPEGFETTGAFLKNDQGQRFILYRRACRKGEWLSVPNTGFVAVNYASAMPPAFDLRPSVSYDISDALLLGEGVSREKQDGRPAVIFSGDRTGSVRQKIRIGIAGRYAIQIRYANPNREASTGRLTLVSPEGSVLQNAVLHFPPTRPGKWGTVEEVTTVEINAGDYEIRLSDVSSTGLALAGLKVQ